MNLERIQGVIPPTITPFDENEGMDEAALRREVEFLSDAGVHGISFGGSTGEGALLTDDEIAGGIAVIRKQVPSSFPVVCGVIRNSSRAAVMTGLRAKAEGADALMVTPTHYFNTDDQGNAAFFREVKEAVGLPIIVYNVIRSNPIMPGLARRMARDGHIWGIKQSVGGIHALTDMIATAGESARIFGAQDDLMHVSYLLGAVGAISAIISAFPRECVEQWNAVRRGDFAKANEIHYRLLPVWRRIEGGAFPSRIKAALNLMGRNVGSARRPMLSPNPAELKELQFVLRTAGFIS